ncbi:uncharacterized protein [Porites lutea]|uniref:uncharacterized protein n=1 Tax=Porites lutea TaxID=51062 RepID=UPI003CC66F46
MSSVQKSSQPDKHRSTVVYHVLDTFIRENMLRRFFSFRRPKLDEKETVDELEKENIAPNSQTNPLAISKITVGEGKTNSTGTAELDTTTNTESKDCKENQNPLDKPDNKTVEDELSQKEKGISNSELQKRTSTLSDTERSFKPLLSFPLRFSDVNECEKLKNDVSSVLKETDSSESTKDEESDRCESTISADDKDESGIEQDFEPTGDEPAIKLKPNDYNNEPRIKNECPDNSITENVSTELNNDLESSAKTTESLPSPLVPINLKSHLKRNDKIKSPNRNFNLVSGNMEHIYKSCKSSPEKCASFTPLANTNKPYTSPYRTQYSRRPLATTPAWQHRRSKAPEMFGDIVIKDRFKARTQFPSPSRKGILKHPNGSRLASNGVKHATATKKSKLSPPKGKRNSTSSDSGLSDEEGSSGEEQKRMPVKKIFSNQQALRKKIDDLNGMLKTMEQQKAELQTVLRIIEEWSEDLRSVERTKLGVPYIRAVKQTLAKQRVALSSKKSDFNRRLTKLKEAEVPFNEEFGNLIQQLRKEVTYVVRDQRKYSARRVENIRQLQGRVIGTCNAILAVYYEG